MITLFLIIWAFVGITCVIIGEFVCPKNKKDIRLSDVLLIIVLGSTFGGFWIIAILILQYEEHEDEINALLDKLNIVIWERK